MREDDDAEIETLELAFPSDRRHKKALVAFIIAVVVVPFLCLIIFSRVTQFSKPSNQSIPLQTNCTTPSAAAGIPPSPLPFTAPGRDPASVKSASKSQEFKGGGGRRRSPAVSLENGASGRHGQRPPVEIYTACCGKSFFLGGEGFAGNDVQKKLAQIKVAAVLVCLFSPSLFS